MIKRFESKEYSQILRIWERSVSKTHHFLRKEDFTFYKSIVSQLLPEVELFVFEEDNVTKGFLGVSDNSIEMLFVDPEYFGQKVGKSLLFFAIYELHLNRVDVNEQNVRAYNFYTHFGFRNVGRDEVDGLGKPYPIIHLQLDEHKTS